MQGPAPRSRIHLLARSLAASLMLLAGPLLSGCATLHSPDQVQGVLDETVAAAKIHHGNGDDPESAQLLEAVLRLDPGNSEAEELRSALSPEIDSLFDHPMLGSNYARRPNTERSTAAKVALYLPDRILDLFDIVSFDAHVGTGAFLNYHATRAIQAGIGFRGTGGIGWHDHRSFGFLGQAESGIVVVALGAQAYAGSLAGTSGVQSTADALVGLHQPSDRLYQELRDYWAVGTSVTILLFGLEYDLHLAELVDFFLGWGLVDILNDDFAHTRSLRLSNAEYRLIGQLGEMERSEETMDRFREIRASSEE